MKKGITKYVICKICNKKFKKITNTHLKKHNLTIKKYKESYGDSIISIDTLVKYSEITKRLYSEGKNMGFQKGHKMRKGCKLTEEHKRKIGLKSKGRKAWNKGMKDVYKLSEQQKRKISLFMKNLWKTKNMSSRNKRVSEALKGKYIKEKSWNWLGGKSFEPYGIKFDKNLKEIVRKRDNYKCQECGYTEKQLGYNLSVHHIDYNKQNSILENLICLCKSCHAKTNFNRKDWTKYYEKKI